MTFSSLGHGIRH